ncbi:MAG: hypothetical protein ACOZF2_18670 [Thermodesulfobacteriota bacterium]
MPEPVTVGHERRYVIPSCSQKDTIRSRLMGLAQPDEIIVGAGTYHHCQGYFHFERLSPLVVKEKAAPVQAFLLRAPRREPSKIRHLSRHT